MRRWPGTAALVVLLLDAGIARGAAGETGDAASHPVRMPESAPAARLRIATWNIEWLARRSGEGPVPRRAADYRRLAAVAARLDADVIALQEIDGPEAARRVFDPKRYDFFFTGDEGNRQRPGFAVRRGLRVTRHADVTGLAVETGARRGADITLHLEGGDLRLLAVHLKSGCAGGPLDGPAAPCRTLRRQGEALERWVDARAREGVAFGVLGDFNRRFEPPDRFWIDLDDGEPAEADLVDLGSGRRPACWRGRYRRFVDHVVLSRVAAARVVAGSFLAPDYLPEERRFEATLSDHCPLVFELEAGVVAGEGSPRPVTR